MIVYLLIEISRRMLRRKGRSLLTLGIAMLLFSCMALYLGNLASNEKALAELAKNAPVTVQVCNRDGSEQVGLEIEPRRIETLMGAGVHAPLFTAFAAGNLKEINRVENVKVCDTTITGANSPEAIAALSSARMDFSSGWDASFLGGDKQVCLVEESYAARQKISIGERLTFPVYILKYDSNNSFRFVPIGDVGLTVIGSYLSLGGGADGTANMIVPVDWLRKAVEDNGNTFTYGSFSGTLDDPLNLNSFKTLMKENHFVEIQSGVGASHRGEGLLVNDKLFIETATNIKKNLESFRQFQTPFFLAVVFLTILVVFLVLRSSRPEIAIAYSLGRPRVVIAAGYFIETALLMVLGCLCISPFLLWVTGIGTGALLQIFILFFSFSCLGILTALLLLLRFDAMALLTKTD